MTSARDRVLSGCKGGPGSCMERESWAELAAGYPLA